MCVTCRQIGGVVIGLVVLAVLTWPMALAEEGKVDESRRRAADNLKKIGAGLDAHYRKFKHYPPQAIFDKDGKPLLSWRVLLLPYLGQNDLYKEFRLDESWDSPDNKKLLAKMPGVFKAPVQTTNAHGTIYQGLHGTGAFFQGKRGMLMADCLDGVSCTIAVIEAAKDVPWTKPEDVPFDAKNPLFKRGGVSPKKGFHALFIDGHVSFLPRTVTDEQLVPLITRNAGDKITLKNY